MSHNNKLSLRALLVAALLFFTAAPAAAQTQLVGTGRGDYLAPNGVNVHSFTYYLTQSSNGTVHGFALWRLSNSLILWRIDSVATNGATQAFAGPIVAVAGTPPASFAVGVTAFTAVEDNGFASADRTVGLSAVPAALGNPTIQQIQQVLGPPPPGTYRSLLNGNIWIR